MTEQMRYIAVIQARMGSTRLPGKVLRDMAGKPMLERIINNVSNSKRISKTVVATSDLAENQEIVNLCNKMGVAVYRGSERDVLSRMMIAVEQEKADVMVRLTGDNPLVTGDLIDLVLEELDNNQNEYDYIHTLDGSGWPYGLAVEAVRVSCLREAMKSTDELDREHVTFYVRNRPNHFRHHFVICPMVCESMSATVDTLPEFEKVRHVFDWLIQGNLPMTYGNVLKALQSNSRAKN